MRKLLIGLAVLVLTFETDISTNLYRRTTGDMYIESYFRENGTFVPAHYKTQSDAHRYAYDNSPGYETGMKNYFYQQLASSA